MQDVCESEDRTMVEIQGCLASWIDMCYNDRGIHQGQMISTEASVASTHLCPCSQHLAQGSSATCLPSTRRSSFQPTDSIYLRPALTHPLPPPSLPPPTPF